MADETPPTTPTPPPAADTPAAWRRVRRAFRWRASRSQLVGGALLAVLGFTATVQVQALRTDQSFSSTPRSQLVQYLDSLQQRSRRLESQISSLEQDRASLLSGADKSKTAVKQAEDRLTTLRILAGTLEAKGQGIRLTIADTRDPVTATLVVNIIEELRDAGAEAIEINDRVRIVAGSYVLDGDNGQGLVVDGTTLLPAYRIDAIGDSKALASAMNIPGGISDEVGRLGGKADIEQRTSIRIDSLHTEPAPKYARQVKPGSR